MNQPSWKFRRRAVFGTMIFSASVIAYVAWRWEATSLAETLALGSFGLIGTVVAAYVGGAAYEDVRLHKRHDESNDDLGEETYVH